MGCTCGECLSVRWRLLQELRSRPRERLAEVCARLGVARSTGYKWQRRYGESGETRARSRAPRRCGRSKRDAWYEKVLVVRRRHRCGARKVRWYLRREHGGLALPSI